MLDLLTIMSDKVTVRLKLGEDNYVMEQGRCVRFASKSLYGKMKQRITYYS